MTADVSRKFAGPSAVTGRRYSNARIELMPDRGERNRHDPHPAWRLLGRPSVGALGLRPEGAGSEQPRLFRPLTRFANQA